MEELFASTFEDPPYVDDFAFGRRDGHAALAITLTFYDWKTEAEAEAKIESDDPRGFTMGALMHQVQRVYDEGAHANDRIFEGLKLKAPGRYSIETGS